MDRREQIRDFILLLQKNDREIQPYYDLLGDLSIYDTIYETEIYIAKLLHINVEGDWSDFDIIDEYAYCGYINWNGERIEDIERFLDLYLQWEAADEEKSV